MTSRGHSRTRSRRGVVAACVALVTLVLAGCTSLPNAGAPQPFEVSVPDSDPLDLAARAPTKGADPQSLVTGFLLACAAGQSDDFATARLFLTSDAASGWDPSTEVQVYSTDSTPQVAADSGTGEVTVSAPAVASVSTDGEMALPDSGAQVTRRFELTQESGEWRISGLEDGVVISESSFTAAYQQASLYFPSTDGQVLVADPRWYPSKRLPTHLLTGLIAGPAASVAPSVTTALPADASLPSQGIDITDQVAHVNLEGTAPDSPQGQRLLAWQLSATLTQTSAVNEVDLRIAGARIATDDLPSGPTYSMESAIASVEDGFATLTGSALSPLVSRDLLGADAEQPALSPAGGATVAWVTQEGVGARRLSDGRQLVHSTDAPTWPSVDRSGWVWSTSMHTAGATWTAFSVDGQVVEIDSPFTDSSTTTALRVSPDGARVVVLRRIGSEQGIWVAPVRRDAQGVPVGVGDPVSVPGGDAGVVDVSWAGSMTLVALHGVSGGTELMVMPLGGRSATLTAPASAEHVTAGASPSTVYVRTDEGTTLSRSGSVWQPLGAQVRDVAFPG